MCSQGSTHHGEVGEPPRGARRTGRRFITALVTCGAVVAGAAAIAGCGASAAGAGAGHNTRSARYGTIVSGQLPSPGTPANGGTLTIGQISGSTPTYISPLNPSAECGDADFTLFGSLYAPLYFGPVGAHPIVDPAQSLAKHTAYSGGDRTVTITLRSGVKWSNGQPVDAQDVVFYMDLLRAALKESVDNWCQYAPGEFPDNVASYHVAGPDTVVFQLKHSVNPLWFTLDQMQATNGGVYALPAQAWNIDTTGGKHLSYANPVNARKIYNYINKSASTLSTWATNPLWKVVDGPYKLTSFNPTNSSYTLAANPMYGLGRRSHYAKVDFETFTSPTAQMTALQEGQLDIGNLDVSTESGAIPGLERQGFSVFGTPAMSWAGGYINFTDRTDDFGKVAAQQYVRAAFAHLVNQPEIIKGVYHGWAVPAYGPVATAPYSPYVPSTATANPYPYDPAAAVALLKSHGWHVVPNGRTTCEHPGLAADECGAGIPKGTPIAFVWANPPESETQTNQLESEQFTSVAKADAGITVTIVNKTRNYLEANWADTIRPQDSDDWGVNNYGGVSYDFYPTQNGILTPGSEFDYGAWNDPVATRLMDASIVSPSRAAIVREVTYLSRAYPVFWMPDQDVVYAVAKSVGGSANAFLYLGSQEYAANLLYRKRSS